jgi:hypothetical protein
MKEAKQYMFVLNRDKTISGTSGHSIEFKKGVPVHVPREMHETVLEKGAVPADELDLEPPKRSEVPNEQVDRDILIKAAMEQIVERNTRDEFAANGAPSRDAIAKIVGFTVNKKECDELWKKLQAGEEE